jgi:hypothetical protein
VELSSRTATLREQSASSGRANAGRAFRWRSHRRVKSPLVNLVPLREPDVRHLPASDTGTYFGWCLAKAFRRPLILRGPGTDTGGEARRSRGFLDRDRATLPLAVPLRTRGCGARWEAMLGRDGELGQLLAEAPLAARDEGRPRRRNRRERRHLDAPPLRSRFIFHDQLETCRELTVRAPQMPWTSCSA